MCVWEGEGEREREDGEQLSDPKRERERQNECLLPVRESVFECVCASLAVTVYLSRCVFVYQCVTAPLQG